MYVTGPGAQSDVNAAGLGQARSNNIALIIVNADTGGMTRTPLETDGVADVERTFLRAENQPRQQ